MPGFTYRIESFRGLDQSRGESLTAPCFSPDAMNMDSSDGELAVTKGYSRFIPEPVPAVGTSGVDRVCFFRGASGTIPMAITGGFVYTYSNGEWTRAYSYPLVLARRHYSVLMTRIGMTDTMLIADGANSILKFDGESFSLFGSAEACSDIAVSFITMFRSRLFAAGDYEHPNRLYYSKLPGGERSIEDWGPDDDSPSVEGGHIEIGTTDGDPITALCAISNQLLIIKQNSVWRLIGDRPGNFTVEPIARDTTPVADTATAVWRDVIYYVSENGLGCFNGVDAAPTPDARRIRRIMDGADVSDSRAAVAGDKLYFTVRKASETRLIEYDLTERVYMQFGGFTASDIAALDGSLIIANSERYLEKWGTGSDFDGVPIEAYWQTPLTDLGDKSVIKSLRGLYLRGETENEGRLRVETRIGVHSEERTLLLPETPAEAAEIPLSNEGRAFSIRISNELGSRFRLTGGIELEMSVRKRTE